MNNFSNYIIDVDNGTIFSKKRNRYIGATIKNGYVIVNLLSDDGNYVSKGVHSVIWETANGEIPDGYVVHHRNENKSDNRLENLQLVSRAEHMTIHHKGKPLSEEHKSKLCHTGMLGKTSKFKGKTFEEIFGVDANAIKEKISIKTKEAMNNLTEEKKRQMQEKKSNSMKGHIVSQESRNKSMEKQGTKVDQFSLDGNYIKTWESMLEIKRQLGFDNSHIGRCCSGKQKTSNGFIWKYKE